MKVVVKKSGHGVPDSGRVILDASQPQEFVLADLLAGITDENVHAEIDFGPPIGRERF